MSQLQKMIARLSKPQGPGIGFGVAAREKPRQMLLAVLAADVNTAKALLAAGADVAIACATDAQAVKSLIEGLAGKDTVLGAWVSAIDAAGAEALQAAGCDFVISTLDGTAADAVDSEKMGIVVAVEGAPEDSTLRALGPLGLDGLFVEHRSGGGMSLAGQLELVRLSSFSGSQLLVTVSPDASLAELRVLRDSGGAVVVTPEKTTADQVKALVERLKALPPPRKPKHEGQEMALVPSVSSSYVEGEDGEEEEEV